MIDCTALVGLGYGDESKGSVTDWLCRQSQVPLVIRFNGGPQAAHNVVTPEGKHHTFAQFGSGTLAGAKTFLAAPMLVNPLHLLQEEAHLYELGVPSPLESLRIDGMCKIITPWHKALNKIREDARSERHGSCGQGVGEAMRLHLERPELTLRARSPYRELAVNVRNQLWQEAGSINSEAPGMSVFDDDNVFEAFMAAWRLIQPQIVDSGWLIGNIHRFDHWIFEGAQGVLLDEWHGFHPYTTWSTTTFANVDALTRKVKGLKVRRLGLLRNYSTRHGAGPFVAESEDVVFPETHNAKNAWQGSWRRGYFDHVAARYAVQACGGVDGIVLTHADRYADKSVAAYEIDGETIYDLPVAMDQDLQRQEDLTNRLFKAIPVLVEHSMEGIERLAPVVAISTGPTANNKKWL